jgi:hypothetical protein
MNTRSHASPNTSPPPTAAPAIAAIVGTGTSSSVARQQQVVRRDAPVGQPEQHLAVAAGREHRRQPAQHHHLDRAVAPEQLERRDHLGHERLRERVVAGLVLHAQHGQPVVLDRRVDAAHKWPPTR